MAAALVPVRQAARSSARPHVRRARAAAVVLLGFVALFAPARLQAQTPPPELTAAVNDFADVIPPDVEAALTDLSQRLLTASGDALVVATVRNTEGWGDIRTYATKMFENGGRGIGQRGRDNGILLLLALDDRKVWVEVGYELEAFVTDGFAGETSREVMLPFFREGRYGDGLQAGATRLASRIAEGRRVSLDVPAAPAPPATDSEPDWSTIVMVFFLIFVLPRIGRRFGKRTRGWQAGSGSWGGGSAGGSWSGGSSWGGGFGGFGGGRSGGGGGGASW